MTNVALPALTTDSGLTSYLVQVRHFPMLEPEEELRLATSWRQEGNVAAAHKLVTSHLRLVVKIAMGYRGYGLPVSELIAEGNIGLMQAVKKFDPTRGFRLATYAIWWIRASIQEYILHSWSLVKMGTTAAQKKLFFNLRRLKKDIQAIEEGDLRPEQVTAIARQLVVSEEEVVNMNRRLAGPDQSLNAPLQEEGEGEWQDWLADDRPNAEVRLLESDEHGKRVLLLQSAMAKLNERERRILEARQLQDEPATLEDLSKEFGVSRERVRQIEARALKKVEANVRAAAQ